ncbi:MAG: glycoside hydrolase family 43 protein [Bacteroidota bacterium]
MSKIYNPILRGFNPDPSIIRVGEDYYIATSTFEWFPGVQIHHSRDLKNWTLCCRPLNRLSQLNLIGNPDSCGVWAPCLSYDQGTFYLVYSNVRSFDGVWKDTPNYLVTTQEISGEWSDPVFLGSYGFDASLFHDEDGKKWYTSLIVDHRKGKLFGGIILQEYDSARQQLVGPVHHIFEGSELGITEGPHLYKRRGYYYLLTAEGGTEYGHAVSLARSKAITGPYELHPDNPILTAREHPAHPLQKAGHADLLHTADNQWYAVFLVGRPLRQRGRCPLGRETAIARMIWKEDDWLYLEGRDKLPPLDILALADPNTESPEAPRLFVHHTDFDEEELDLHFQSLRIPITEDWCTLKERPGFCRLYGQESLSSFHRQSLIARRLQHFHVDAATALTFLPNSFQQMAGLVCYYNTSHWYYLYMSGEKAEGQTSLQISCCDHFAYSEIFDPPIALNGATRLYLKVKIDREHLQFYYALQEGQWQPVGPVLDGSRLSDDYIQEGSDRYRPAFTGAFIGLCCQDLSGQRLYADFDWLEYVERNGP